MSMSLRKIIFIAVWLILTYQMRMPSAERFGYHTDYQIQERIDELANEEPHFVKKTCSASRLYNYLEIGTSSNTTINAVIMCNIHAREIIATEICLNWIQQLQNNSLPIHKYFTRVFYIANPNRQAFIDHEQDCILIHIIQDVDTNRNFPTDFDHWNVNGQNQTYGGDAPFDQPLSQCLNELFTQKRPDLFVDVHSGTNGTVFYQQGVNNEAEIQLFNDFNTEVCNSEMKLTTLAKDGETINGHIFADIKVRLNVPFSFLIQTYKGPDSAGCFLMFNPIGDMKENLIKRYTNVLNFIFAEVFKKQIEQKQ